MITHESIVSCIFISPQKHPENREVFAKILDAEIVTPQQANVNTLKTYDLVGFGAGIDSGKHYKPLLDFADTLPQAAAKKAFIFSTSAIQGETKSPKTTLRSEKYCSLKVM